MTARVALLLAVIACSSKGPAPTTPVEKSQPIATSTPGTTTASPPPADAAVVVPEVARTPFQVAWRKSTAGEGGFAHSVAVRPDGAVVIAGDAHLTAWTKQRQPKLRPAVIAMLDAKGALAWARDFGVGTIESVAVTADGIVACGALDKTGMVVLALAADGKPRWRVDVKGLGCEAIAAFPDGKLALVGMFIGEQMLGGLPLHPFGEGDVFVAVLDAGGKPQWVATVGGAKPDTVHGLAIANGALYVTGWYEGTAKFQDKTVELVPSRGKAANPSNMFLARFEPRGNVAWVTSLGVSDSFDRGWAVAATDDGVVVTGELKGNAFLARYGADGKQRWQREAAGTGRAVLALPIGDILLATYEHGDPGIATLARYSANGDLVDRAKLGGPAGTRYDVFGIARNERGRIALAGMLEGESTISGELAQSTQKVTTKDGQGVVVEVLEP